MNERRRILSAQDLTPPLLYLYNEGDECTDITGGWESVGYHFWAETSKYPAKACSVTRTDQYIQGWLNENNGEYWFGYKNLVDVSKYTKINFELEGATTQNETSGYCQFHFSQTNVNTNTYYQWKKWILSASWDRQQYIDQPRKIWSYSLDTLVSSPRRFGFLHHQYTGRLKFKLYKMWLSKD